MMLQADIGLMQYLNLGGLGMLIVAFVVAIRYLQGRNDNLMQKLEESHALREEKFLELLKDQNEKHEECNQRYFDLSTKWQTVVENNTRVCERIEEKMERKP